MKRLPPFARLFLLLAIPVIEILAPAPGGRVAVADEATWRNLVERATEALQQAERLHEAGAAGAGDHARRARLLLEQADGEREGDPTVAFLAVQACVFAQDRLGAALWLDRYARRTPYGEQDMNLHYARALVASYLDERPDLALVALDRMRALSPGTRHRARDVLHYRVLQAEGARLAGARDCERAPQVLQRAVRLAVEMGDRRRELAARANVGLVYRRCSRLVESEDVFRRLAEEEPAAALWAWHRALALIGLDRLEDAVGCLETVVRLLDEDRVPPAQVEALRAAHLRLGTSWRALAARATEAERRRALVTQARAALARYVALAPRSVPGRYWLGVVLYEDFGLPYEALVHLEEAYRLDPLCDASLRTLVQIALRHPPPPSQDPSAASAWRERLRVWQEDLQANEAARAAARKAREDTSEDGTDGCT